MIVNPDNKFNSNFDADVKEIYKTLEFWCVPGSTYELRILNAGKYGKETLVGYFRDLETLAETAKYYSDSGQGTGIYLTLNPVNPALLARANQRMISAKAATADSEIVSRKRFFLDFDPVRPAGISSSAEEHCLALERAKECRQWLTSQGWPCPLYADSGNGAHLVYAIDLPNDNESAVLISRVLKAIAKKFGGNGVSGDLTVFNAARINKLYGTAVRKGDSLPERPHRMSAILDACELVTVTKAQLQMIAATVEFFDDIRAEKVRLDKGSEGGDSVQWVLNFIEKHDIDCFQKADNGMWRGRWILAECPFCNSSDKGAAITVNQEGRIGFSCKHNRCVGKDWHQFRELYDPAKNRKKEEQKPEMSRAYTFSPMSAKAFAEAKFTQTWLVERMLVAKQPAICGGPKKSLKTSLLCDLTISLGSGTPFLGRFNVPKRVRTVLISGESGESTLQETALRICAARGITLASTDTEWDFRLPRASRSQELSELAVGLARLNAQVVIIDPLYLCLLAGSENKNAGNLFDMGPLLSEVAGACLAAGATPILTHHNRKNLHQPHDPAELEDMAFSGVQEFARQWLLINRREKYVPGTGDHKLWLSVGGSAGHSGLWGLDVAEGIVDDKFKGRKWNCQIMSVNEAAEEKKNQAKKSKEVKQHVQDQQSVKEVLQHLLSADVKEKKLTRNQLRELCAWNVKKFDRILSLAEFDDLIKVHEDQKPAWVTLTRTGRSKLSAMT